ncbi:hypothetical protein [Neglectibacter timonensis]
MYKKLLALCLAALLTASAAGCSQGTEGSSAPAEGGSAAAVILFLIIFSLSTVREILGRRSE